MYMNALKLKTIINQPRFYKIIVLFFVLFVLSPLIIVEGIPFGNDASFHLSRVSSLAEALKSGVVFPGVYADYFDGSGYGSGLFYPDIFLYIPALLMVIGFSNIVAYKLFLMLLTVLMSMSMYWSVKQIWHSDFGAMISSVFCLLTSFYRTDLYVRSSVGELLAFVFIPLIIVGFWQVIYGDHHKWRSLTLGFSGLVLSHVLSAVMMSMIAFVFLLYKAPMLIGNAKRFKSLLKATLWSIVLTAFFLFPMIEQLIISPVWGDVGLLGDIKDWAVSLNDLIFAFPQPLGIKYVPPSGIGFVLFIIAILGITCFKKNRMVCVLSILGMFFLFCTSTFFPWNWLAPFFGKLQFPWRLYLFISVFWCFAAGEIIREIFEKVKFQWIFAGITILLMMIGFTVNLRYTYSHYPAMIVNTYPTFAAGCEYLPREATLQGIENTQKQLENSTQRTNYNKYSIILERKGINELPIIDYLGYQAKLNGKEIEVLKNEKGMSFVKTDETGVLNFHYTGTPLRKISFVISIGGVLLLVGACVYNHKKKGKII